MQASRILTRRSLFLATRRNASSDVWMPARWSEQTRRESGLVFVDDPPTAPLSENHEIGDSQCDFGNWFDKGEDVSTAQAVTGLGVALGFCFLIYRTATYQASKKPANFTMRELPMMAADIPAYVPNNPNVPTFKMRQ